MSLEWIGIVGTGLVVVAYLPQIKHLVSAKCASGVSLGAYLVWSLSAALLLTYAISTADVVFIALQTYQALALTTIYVLARRHCGRSCEIHCGAGVGAHGYSSQDQWSNPVTAVPRITSTR